MADIYKLIDRDRFPLLTQSLLYEAYIERFIWHFKKVPFNFAGLTFLICSPQRVLLIILNFCRVFFLTNSEKILQKLSELKKVYAAWISEASKMSTTIKNSVRVKVHYKQFSTYKQCRHYNTLLRTSQVRKTVAFL